VTYLQLPWRHGVCYDGGVLYHPLAIWFPADNTRQETRRLCVELHTVIETKVVDGGNELFVAGKNSYSVRSLPASCSLHSDLPLRLDSQTRAKAFPVHVSRAIGIYIE
jgi:hypothetical protein